ncbi:MAG: endopeptidase La [Candidatus Hydrogenedentes bacterium]|nr:endopeptidase La [Candidatus Hydrogenedentota bacterium]
MTDRNSANSATGDYLPLLPLKDMVVFPRMVVPLLVGRPASLMAVEDSLTSGRSLFLCAQRDATIESPGRDDLRNVGTVASILQTLRMPDGSLKIIVEGMARAELRRLVDRGNFVEAGISRVEELPPSEPDAIAAMRLVLTQFEGYVRLSQRVAPEVVVSLRNIEEAGPLADLICAHLPLRVEERQELLEIESVQTRLERITSILIREQDLLEIERKVRERVREQMERGQREYYLHEQLKAIHQELGNREEGSDEYAELKKQIEKAQMPDEVREKAVREFGRYERMPAMSPEGSVIRTYLEWLIDMPWAKRTRDALDLGTAKRVLDEDHYGLSKVKERILEFLAVRKLSKSTRGPILCLVGPPGVGKTSLGQSVARAMGRKFVRISLGGVRDEAEIRGHRRTYIGALPGRIVQGIKKAGVKNPVFMLDEVDKMSMDFRGDPSSALLEVLDPEQNKMFSDHYLEVDLDLREVFFITTANSEYDIPPALHDRMELVRLSGYSTYEKERIAQLYLIPKQMKECGLKLRQLHFTGEAIRTMIQRYTREAGVRELERQIANICRKVAKRLVTRGRVRKVNLDERQVLELLGPEEYSEMRAEVEPKVGVAVGLAWTMAGGDILHIETSTTKGKGILTLTGQLGEVMKESAHAAYTYLRAHAKELRISPTFYRNMDLHVHVPEGAIPKDGPSAGVGIAVSMLSALRNRPPKALLAMTGEITLRGRILPVGGVKEKVLAAHRAGIKEVILPKENQKDLTEVPSEVREELKLLPVSTMEEVLRQTFSDKHPKSESAQSR